MTGAIKPVPGEITYKPSNTARGMPDDPAEPVVTAACLSYRTRAMGEAFSRHSLHPLVFGGSMNSSTCSGIICGENARSCLVRSSNTHSVSFRGARRASPESITTIGSMDSGLVLSTPRNDDGEVYGATNNTGSKQDGCTAAPARPQMQARTLAHGR